MLHIFPNNARLKNGKIAVVFHGIVGGLTDRNGLGELIDVEICAKTFKHNVLSHYDCDIFAHSWTIEAKDKINEIYRPTASLFQPQEFFGLNKNNNDKGVGTLRFRTISRYESLRRAMKLKQDHEKKHNFKYQLVLMVRYDLVFFKRVYLERFLPSRFYICGEPYWYDNPGYTPRKINPNRRNICLHDIIFVSGSKNADRFVTMVDDIDSKYTPNPHRMLFYKLHDMFPNYPDAVHIGFDRYIDMEIYRMVMNPSQSKHGFKFGGNETKQRLEELLKEIK